MPPVSIELSKEAFLVPNNTPSSDVGGIESAAQNAFSKLQKTPLETELNKLQDTLTFLKEKKAEIEKIEDPALRTIELKKLSAFGLASSKETTLVGSCYGLVASANLRRIASDILRASFQCADLIPNLNVRKESIKAFVGDGIDRKCYSTIHALVLFSPYPDEKSSWIKEIALAEAKENCLVPSRDQTSNCRTFRSEWEYVISKIRSIPDLEIRTSAYEEFANLCAQKNVEVAFIPESYRTLPEKLVSYAAHANALKNQSENSNYESMLLADENWAEQFLGVLENLPPSFDSSISAPQLEKITCALDSMNSKDFLKRAESIKKGELNILRFGYIGHASTLIFYKGQMILCDRASESGLEIARIDLEKTPLTLVQELSTLYNIVDLNEYLLIIKNLFAKLQLPNAPVSPLLKQLEIDKQTAGNCTYASLEGALLVALALMQEEAGCFDAEKFKEFSKELTTHFSLSKLEDYLEQSPEALVDNYLVDASCSKQLPHLEKSPLLHGDFYPQVVSASKRPLLKPDLDLQTKSNKDWNLPSLIKVFGALYATLSLTSYLIPQSVVQI